MAVNIAVTKIQKSLNLDPPGFFSDLTIALVVFISFFSPFVFWTNVRQAFLEFAGIKAYLITFSALAAVLLLSIFSSRLAEFPLFLFLTLPVVVSALYGGIGPALVAICGGVMISNFAASGFNLSQNLFTLSPANLAFILQGVVISGIGLNQRRRARSFNLHLQREKTARLRAQNSNLNLKKLEKQKDDFIAIAAHELKNPLASIKAFTQILGFKTAEFGDSQVKDYIIRMEEQTTRLNELITQLFDVSNMSSGQMRLNKTAVNFDEFILSTMIDLQHTIFTHRLVVEGHTKAIIEIDPDRVREILINLVTNAVKYSPGELKVVVHLSSNPQEVIISVRDSGPGINTRDQKKIFQRFYRLRGPHVSGLGLGLFIASELVRLHKGRIWLTSTLGKGSTFFFSLPKE